MMIADGLEIILKKGEKTANHVDQNKKISVIGHIMHGNKQFD